MKESQTADDLKDIIKGIAIAFTIINCTILLYYAYLTVINKGPGWFILNEFYFGFLAVIGLGLTIWIIKREGNTLLMYTVLFINIASLPVVNIYVSSRFLYRLMEPVRSVTSTRFVQKTLPGDLSGDGKVNQVDLNILYSGLGVTTLDDKENILESKRILVETSDARDLNHDGFLDKHDVEIMKGLIGTASLRLQANCDPKIPRINENITCTIEVLNEGPNVASNTNIEVHFELKGPGVKPILDDEKVFYSRIASVSSHSIPIGQGCSEDHPKPDTLNERCFVSDIEPKEKALATLQVKAKSPGNLKVDILAKTVTPGIDDPIGNKSNLQVELQTEQKIQIKKVRSMDETDIEELIHIMRQAVKNRDTIHTRLALNQLSNFGTLAIPRLTTLVHEDPNPRIRYVAVAALGEMPAETGSDVIPILVSVMRKDHNESVRLEATRSLVGPMFDSRNGRKKTVESAIPDLIEFLRESPSNHGDAVMDALIRIGPVSIKPLKEFIEKHPRSDATPKAKQIFEKLTQFYPREANLNQFHTQNPRIHSRFFKSGSQGLEPK